MSLSFDLTPFFVTAGQVLSSGWVLFSAPLGILVGFWLVKKIKHKLTHRAGVERRRSHRWIGAPDDYPHSFY